MENGKISRYYQKQYGWSVKQMERISDLNEEFFVLKANNSKDQKIWVQ